MTHFSIKKILVLFVFTLIILSMVILYFLPIPKKHMLQNGDLIFQTSTSNQASAIIFATKSLYSHTGIIKRTGDKISVIEAIGTTRETDLEEWIERGVLSRISIYRHKHITPSLGKKIVRNAKKYYGKRYDVFFSFDNNTLYCSELPYLLYNNIGLKVGKVEKISELNFDNFLVHKLIEKRWQRFPKCQKPHYNFENCYDLILNQTLISPVSLSKDPTMEKIYTNYWFW